ncbi:MAG TPA: SGNH/GDSL hydrolase family protein [Chthoniobacter sp.]
MGLTAVAMVIGVFAFSLGTSRAAESAPARIFASSHQAFAQGTAKAGPDSIRESRVVVYFQEDLTDLVLGYANYYIGATGENNHGQGDVEVSFALEYNDQFTPFTTGGQRFAICRDGAAFATDPAKVSVKGGTYGAIRMRERKLAPDATANAWLWSTEGDPAFNEGSITHSDPQRDWTLGGAPGENVALVWSVDTAGVITPRIARPGSGITTKGVAVGVLDSQRRGRDFGYIGTVKDGSLAGWCQQKGGAGYSSDTWIGPSGMGGYGAGGGKQTYGPCVIAGTSAHGTAKSVLLLGDSISAGFGAGDKRGDIQRNFGIYARALSKKANVCNAATPGLTAYACDYRYGRTRALVASILHPQIVLICLGTNDIDQSVDDSKSKTPAEALRGHLQSIAGWWRKNCGSEIWLGTILPRVTLARDGHQTPRPGFESGGVADRINAALRDKTLLPGAGRIIDGRAVTQDSADASLWRMDHGPLTDDGTHPGDAAGIPYLAGQLLTPIP